MLFRKCSLSILQMNASSSAETLIHVCHNTRLHISDDNNSHANVLIYSYLHVRILALDSAKPSFSRVVLLAQSPAEHCQVFQGINKSNSWKKAETSKYHSKYCREVLSGNWQYRFYGKGEGGRDCFRKRPDVLYVSPSVPFSGYCGSFYRSKAARAHHSPPSRAAVRNEWSYTTTPPGRTFWKLTLLPSGGKMWDPA
jgi:hypothetical protein